jgi:kynurenine 3-monooxygenase
VTTGRRLLRVIGAGPAGLLIALLLARRGFAVDVYERRADPRNTPAERGRSINLALAARGVRALERAGLMAAIRPLLVPMRGRQLHERDGSTAFLPYGQREDEVIHSISRATLTRALVDAAAAAPGLSLHFSQACVGVRAASAHSAAVLEMRDEASGRRYDLPPGPTLAADGAGSAVRASLAAQGLLRVRESMLDHDYKELEIPAARAGGDLEREALHIWPRGGFMLIALPNLDGSFTATLFLPREGAGGFASLHDAASVETLFGHDFPDLRPRMPDLIEEFRSHPQGRLGTVYTDPWHVAGDLLLLGDAAHAIVPFHGQGMNCAFEDCSRLDARIAATPHGAEPDWPALFAAFARERRPDTDAIAEMALENYVEMRDSVRDPKFVRQRTLARELERRFPGRFVPRYSMVTFHPEISYSEALRRGTVQTALLAEIDEHAARGAALDDRRLRALIEARLEPLDEGA